MQWIETNWGLYRGKTLADGSVFMQRARAPARPRQACFDANSPGTAFYGRLGAPLEAAGPGGIDLPTVVQAQPGAALPTKVRVGHWDAPQDTFPLTRMSRKTGKMNYLAEAQLEFAFCTLLAAREPNGRMHHLRGLYWNARWQSLFRWLGKLPTHIPIAGGNNATVGRPFLGAPTDKRFAPLFTSTPGLTCLQIYNIAKTNPNIKETDGWPVFDVRY